MEKQEKGMVSLRFEDMVIKAADLGEQAGVPDILGERILQNDLEFQLEEDAEIYEGYGRRGNAFPYRQYHSYSRELKEKKVCTAILENGYLKAVFLPEYGGRLWSLIDKETGRNLLYTNDVLRFSNLAVRNAWFSGGVEWNMGVIGHSPLTNEPLYTAVLEKENETPILRMYELERISGAFYQMDFWLEKEERFLNCRMRIVNESDQVIPMYWWSNIAVPEYEGGRVVVPADRAYTFAGKRVVETDIPYVEGIDITDYQKIERSVDYFFNIREEVPKYIANVDGCGYGLLQMSTGRLRGRKLFSWGNSQASDHWQEFLTENAGRYLELQAGLGKTQYGCLPMAPHTAWEWLEQYGPVQLDEESLRAPHGGRSKALMENLKEQHTFEGLEERLKATKAMAKSRGRLVYEGSGYGALEERRNTLHLEFRYRSEGLQRWVEFLRTGILEEADPKAAPDEFLDDREDIFEKLKNSIHGENRDNWYAHYHLATAYYIRGRLKKARKELKRSLECRENPWACHELACLYMTKGRPEKAVKAMTRGIRVRYKSIPFAEDLSYLRECFRIFTVCEGFRELCSLYEELPLQVSNTSRLRFYYINALHKLGRHETAYELLEKDGGLLMEDIREGEDSLARLWSELYTQTHGVSCDVPYRYDFRAN